MEKEEEVLCYVHKVLKIKFAACSSNWVTQITGLPATLLTDLE